MTVLKGEKKWEHKIMSKKEDNQSKIRVHTFLEITDVTKNRKLQIKLIISLHYL